MHFSQQTLTDPARLKGLLRAFGLTLWVPGDSHLIDRMRVAVPDLPAASAAPEEQLHSLRSSVVPLTSGRVPKSRPSRADRADRADKAPASDAPQVSPAPDIRLMLAQIPGSVWVLEQSAWHDIRLLLSEAARLATGKKGFSSVPFEWPQNLPGVDQSAPRAIEALRGLIRSFNERSGLFIMLGERAQFWLKGCNFDVTDSMFFAEANDLTNSAKAKRQLWLALMKHRLAQTAPD